MRFEVSYPAGATHEVEIPGRVAVLGRDPGCDLVLNDTKCSRRHAVVEDGPEGLVIRDVDSANGLQVNGRTARRARLRPGDVVRLGDVRLKVLPEVEATIVVASEEIEVGLDSGLVRPASRPPPPDRTPAPRAARPRPRGRPLTVTVLIGLWVAVAAGVPATAILLAARGGLGRAESAALVASALVLGVASGVMATGLRALAAWARHLQIAVALLGLLACPFSLASATVLLYLARPEVKEAFEGGRPGPEGPGAGSAEPTFAASLLAMLALGLLATALLSAWLRPGLLR